MERGPDDVFFVLCLLSAVFAILVPVVLAGTSCLGSKTWNSPNKSVLATYS
jgi:hypothetical protein